MDKIIEKLDELIAYNKETNQFIKDWKWEDRECKKRGIPDKNHTDEKYNNEYLK